MVMSVLPPLRCNVSTPESPLKAASPALSPPLRWHTSKHTVAWHTGPSMRWVSVLGAKYKLGTILLVLRRNHPGRSVRVNDKLSGLWFHCHSKANCGVEKSSLRVSERGRYPCTGFIMVSGTRPCSSPSIGQPSFHWHGMRVSTRPTALRSWKIIPYHLPSWASTMVPWPT